jgi:hypothetical protein
MILNLSTTEPNQQLLIYPLKTQAIASVVSFSDVVTGTTGSRFFEKTFSWSRDNFLWSDWLPLTNANLSAAILIRNFEPIFIRVSYLRKGVSSGTLTLDSLSFITTQGRSVKSNAYNNSFIKQFFSTCIDATFFDWTCNVLEKLYKPGTLSNYIVRNDNQDYEQDRSFIEYLRSVAQFFSFFANYANVFETFYEKEVLLKEYLEQKGILLAGNENLEQLQYIAYNWFDQIRKRTQYSVIDTTQITPATTLPGELLRLLNNQLTDELIYGLAERKHVSWNVNNSSPMMRSTANSNHLAKIYIDRNVTAYYIQRVLQLNSVTVNSVNELILNSTSSIGVGGDITKAMVISPAINYCISFNVECTDLAMIKCGVLLFDAAQNTISAIKVDATGSDNNSFGEIKIKKAGIKHSVEVYLFNSDYNKLSYPANGYGNHLKQKDVSKYLIPVVETTTNGEIYITNFRVGVGVTKYSKGFVQASDVIELMCYNRNQQKSFDDIVDIVRDLFIPYTTTLIATNLVQSKIVEDPLYWNDGFNRIWIDVTGEGWFWP